jgi:hypothetical protein
MRTVSWIFYIVGFSLVVLSYTPLVSPEVGWGGWVMGMIGWLMGFLPGVRKKNLSEELAKLDELRRHGVLSDQEFEEAKAKLIGRPPVADQ